MPLGCGIRCCYPTTPVNLTFEGTQQMLEELCEMEGLMVTGARSALLSNDSGGVVAFQSKTP